MTPLTTCCELVIYYDKHRVMITPYAFYEHFLNALSIRRCFMVYIIYGITPSIMLTCVRIFISIIIFNVNEYICIYEFTV